MWLGNSGVFILLSFLVCDIDLFNCFEGSMLIVLLYRYVLKSQLSGVLVMVACRLKENLWWKDYLGKAQSWMSDKIVMHIVFVLSLFLASRVDSILHNFIHVVAVKLLSDFAVTLLVVWNMKPPFNLWSTGLVAPDMIAKLLLFLLLGGITLIIWNRLYCFTCWIYVNCFTIELLPPNCYD